MRKFVQLLGPLVAAGVIAGLASIIVPALASDKTAPAPGSSSDVPAAPAASLQGAAGPFEWTAKFICGNFPVSQYLSDAGPVVGADYKTAVNIHNPSETAPAVIRKSISVALPDQQVGPITIIGDFTLAPDRAFEVDCDEIWLELGMAAGTFVKGFVGVGTPFMPYMPVDVTAVYTAQYVNMALFSEGVGHAIDVEPVPLFTPLLTPDPTFPDHEYATKYVCGRFPGPDPVVDGDYATAINVHDPENFLVAGVKKFVVAEAEDQPYGYVSPLETFSLNSNEAFEIDCGEIMSKTGKLGESDPNPFVQDPFPTFGSCLGGGDEDFDGLIDANDPDCHRKGFVVIRAQNAELDVVPVYTVWRETVAPNNGQGLDIEVLRVSKRSVGPPGVPTSTPTTGPLTHTPTRTPTRTPTLTPTPTETPTITPTNTKVPPPYVLDHFKCYNILNPGTVGAAVILEDQFDVSLGIREDVVVQTPTFFCNPVEKTTAAGTSPINHPNDHLKFYGMAAGGGTGWNVLVRNQFGQQTLTVTNPVALAVPTEKNGVPTSGLLDHYKCYEAFGNPVHAPVNLQDQFGPESGQMAHLPRLFCNPVEKTHGPVVYPILHPADHLVCYDMDPRAVSFSASADNQFGPESFQLIEDPPMLCVPSEKLSFSP